MKKIGIVVNPSKDPERKFLNKTIEQIEKAGYCYKLSCMHTACPVDDSFVTMEECLQDAILGLTLGGDGTLLHAAAYAHRFQVPLLGINLGHLGFLAEMERTEIGELAKLLTDGFTCTERMVLRVQILREERCLVDAVALNDAVIRSQIGKPAHIVLSDGVNDLMDYLCDGFIIASPTGSTAYSMSAGGPILEPHAEGMVVTPICPHTLVARSLVFGTTQQIRLHVTNADRILGHLECDGMQIGLLHDDDIVLVGRHEIPLKLVQLRNKNFFKVLNEKISRRMT